jgi:lipopolysaccharide heptosyltransferase I
MSDRRAFRILISRLSAIGDCVLTLPVLNALRDHFPNAHLAWAIEKSAAPLLAGHPALDQLIIAQSGWLKRPADVWGLRRQLRGLHFDISIDPQSLTKSAVLARLSGAGRRIGFAGDDGRELSKWFNNELVSRSKPHMVDRSLELLRPLGIQRPSVRFDLPRFEASDVKMSAYVQSGPLKNGFAILNMGAGWPSKLWPPERFAAVAEFLGKSCSLHSLIIWVGDEERGRADICAERAGGYAMIAPSTSLTELASLARRAALFVGSDTGPLHLAAALGTPCVGLYGPTLPRNCGPYGKGHQTLQHVYHAGGHRERRSAENDAMRAISAKDVSHACWESLNRRADTHVA